METLELFRYSIFLFQKHNKTKQKQNKNKNKNKNKTKQTNQNKIKQNKTNQNKTKTEQKRESFYDHVCNVPTVSSWSFLSKYTFEITIFVAFVSKSIMPLN